VCEAAPAALAFVFGCGAIGNARTAAFAHSWSRTGFSASCRNPGKGWSFGGPGTGIGGSKGAPWEVPVALGGLLGVICGYGVGVGVPGAPGTGVVNRGGVLAA